MRACSCIYSEYDRVDFYTEVARTARKVHRCSECFQEIFPKEIYVRAAFKSAGEPFEHRKLCPSCVAIIAAFFCDGYGFGRVMEDLDQHVWDERGLISEGCLAALPAKAREVICDMIDRYWEAEDLDREEYEEQLEHPSHVGEDA